jgi:nitrogen regulatory protein P-II 1
MIIRPEKLEEVKGVLNGLHISGLTVTPVSGCGNQKGLKEVYHGTVYNLNLLPKVKVETVVHDKVVTDLISKICETVKTGKIGDGKIFVYNVEQAVRIRTGETAEDAV